MSELTDKRREQFCVGVASGMSLTAAAKAAGYKGDKGNSSRMAKSPAVAARIQEIRDSLPPIVVSEPSPEIVPLSAAHNGQHQPNRIKEFEAIRDEALKRGHTAAASASQRDLIKAERMEQTKGQEAGLSLVALAQKIIPHFRWALRTGGTAEEMACRILGVVDPGQQAELGVPLAKRTPATNGHAKV